MTPPKDTTVIATPLANCWQQGSLMCIDNLNCQRTVQNVELHYKIIFSILREKSACFLKQFPECEVFPVAVRQMAAQLLPEKCRALAIIAPPESVRSVLKSFELVKARGVPVDIFAEEKQARMWLSDVCGRNVT